MMSLTKEMYLDRLLHKIEKLEAENARYREALLKIKIMTDDPYSILYHVAREALKGRK